MSSTDKIKRYFKKAELGINSDADEKIFQDVLQAQQKTIKHAPVIPVNIWRIIMKNPISKLTVAAIVGIVCITGYMLFNGTSNIVLANVLEHIKQVNGVFYQQKMNATTQVLGMEIKQNMSSKIWVSHDYGMRMDMELVISSDSNSFDPNGQTTLGQTYLLPKQNQIITLLPSQKKYMRAEIDEKQALVAKQQGNDPNLMVKQILDCNYISIGKSTIDGIEVEGFQTTDPKFQGGVYSSGKVDIKLWVDVKTQLPVQMEMDVQLGGQTNMKMHSVTYGYQWNVPVDESIFEPVIPGDYTSLTSASVQVSYDEGAVIKGMKLYNDMFGKYPEKLDLNGLLSPIYKLMQEIPEIAKVNNTDNLPPYLMKMKEELEGLSEQEQKQKTMDFSMSLTMSISGLSSFYAQLVKENKDPAYYGVTVTPGDSNQVLMRWKVSDTDYRVIFGDLKAETVTSETLAVLEKTLPK